MSWGRQEGAQQCRRQLLFRGSGAPKSCSWDLLASLCVSIQRALFQCSLPDEALKLGSRDGCEGRG